MLETAFQQHYGTALRVARARSAAAVRTGFPLADKQDLEQEAVVRVWQALAKHDASRAGLRTFIEMVIGTRILSIVCRRRLHFHFEPLSDVHTAKENLHQELELRADVRCVLAGVSAFDQAVALCLIDHSVAETSRHLGVCRARTNRAIGRLRKAFVAAGFGQERFHWYIRGMHGR